MAQIPQATPEQTAQAVAAGALLLDVREDWEYREQHIPGATPIPLAELRQRIHDLPKDRDIYVHCRLGARSARAVELLIAAGFPRVINVLGGIQAWEKAGLPTRSDVVALHTGI